MNRRSQDKQEDKIMATRGDTVRGYENVHRYVTDDGRERFVAALWQEKAAEFEWPTSKHPNAKFSVSGLCDFCRRIQDAPSFDTLEEAAAQAVKWVGRA
jgi:hypothetical protein